MLDFLIDNIFVLFGGRVFQQTIGIPKGTNCAPLLADLFLHAYEADFLQGLLKNWTILDSVIIYIASMQKDTTNTLMSASYFDLHLEIDNGGRWKTKLKFTFLLANLPFIISNISTSPAYRVHISQLIRYPRLCAQCSNFLDRAHSVMRARGLAP